MTNTPQGVYEAPGYQRCKVSFAGSPGPAKRSIDEDEEVIGMWGDWNVTDIEILRDPETLIETPLDFRPGGPLLTARFSEDIAPKGL